MCSALGSAGDVHARADLRSGRDACEKLSESARPISHWSQREIADEAMRRGLIPNISQRSVGRFLKRGRPQAASRPLLADPEAPSPILRLAVLGIFRSAWTPPDASTCDMRHRSFSAL
jgi:hypothetical protein